MQELRINCNVPQDKVTKVVHTRDNGITFVELFYPNGLEITAEMFPDGTVNVNCNKPLVLEADGSYTPVI